MLPLPLTEATVESVEMTGKAYVAVLHLVGDEGAIRLETLEGARRTTDYRRGQPPAEAPPPVALDDGGPEAETEV